MEGPAMGEWVKIFATQSGAIGAVVGVLLLIFWKAIWPTINQRLLACDKEREAFSAERSSFAQERKEARHEFSEALKLHDDYLRRRDVMAAETHKETLVALNNISGEFKALTSELRRPGERLSERRK